MSIVLRIGAVRGNPYGADHLTSCQDATNSDSDVLDIPAAEELCHRPAQTYPGCFGLPYQDHNYGAPPPLSPTPPKSPPAPLPEKVNGVVELEEEAKVPVVSQEEEVVEDSITRCICGFLHDDGYMICCDKCSVWQHIDCMGVDRNNIPENYCCELCEPRKLDFERAKMIQLRKREEIDTSATDTDPEEPANALASLGKKQVQTKPKVAKQRRSPKAGAREKGLLKSAKLARAGQYRRDKKLKLTKKEKENMKGANKKQKLMKNSLARQKKMKKKLSASLSQNKAEQWNNLYGLWNNYEEAKENEYSPEILELLSRAKSNGIHSPHSIGVFPEELLVRLYQVSEVKKNRKGLEATDLIVPGRAVIEFKGKVMLRDRFQHNAVVNQTRPYVLFYSKFEGLDLCIDASAYGGDARFIRRSCIPNSEMCHIIDNGNLHFIVQAKKEIAKGSEITIPFDYNYQDCVTTVECACGRANCPVAKFWKKVKLAQKPVEKQKRKRSMSGEGRVRRNSQSKGSPVKAATGSKSPVRGSPVKSPGIVPLPPSLCEPVVPPEPEVVEAVQVPKSATASRRSSRAASDVKEERDVKPIVKAPPATVTKEHLPKAAPVQSHSNSVDSNNGDPSGAQPVSESEADSSSECPKKMTREERKMEAIMKAFEKMAKREERRKEALARLDKKSDVVKKEEPGEAVHPPHPSMGSSFESGSERVTDPPVAPISPVATFIPSPSTHDLEGKVVIKIEEPSPVMESPVKSQRRPRRQRRRSRVQSMSAAEPLHSTTAPIPLPVLHPHPQLSMIPDTLHLTEEDSRDEIPVDHHLSPVPAATSTPGLPDMAHAVPDSPASYMFHKTKKHLYNEWSVSRVAPDGRQHGGRLDPLEVHVGGQEEFVPYTPSPRNAIEHWQRRHSTSAGCSIRAADSNVGNAKKRWLRQAMHETGPPGAESGSSSPVHAGSCSPNHFASLPSPGGSPPADFVTPLKKRRLARESLSQDQSPPSLPSTPSLSLPTLPDFITATTVVPSCSRTAPATVTSATLAATNEQKLESGVNVSGDEGVVGQQGNSKVADDSGLGLGCNESSVSEMEAEPEMDLDPVSQSSPQQEELSMDGLNSCMAINRTVRLACAGSSSSVTSELRTPPLSAMADSGDVCDSAARDSNDIQTSSISPPSGTSNEASAMEVSVVDSSGAAFEVVPRAQLEESGENVGVGSTDSEVSRPCVRSADVTNRTESEQDEERRVECSTDTSDSLQRVGEEVGEGAVSEGSHRVEESMEVEESGNEASGSACEGSQETERSPASEQSRQPACECQVNSSQDIPYSVRLNGRTGSPNQGEAESNVSSESVVRTQPVLDFASTSGVGNRERNGNCASTSGAGDRERSGNCASTSGAGDRERNVNCASTSGVGDRERSGNCASTSGAGDRERNGNCASTSGVGVRERSGNCASTSGVGDRERSSNCASTSGVGDRERSSNCASTSGVEDRERSGNCASTSSAGDRERSGVCASTSGAGDRERSGVCASTSGVGDRERNGNCASTSGAGDRERNGICASTSGVGDRERSGDCATTSGAGNRERRGICASTSGAGDRERGGVSSAQDSPPVSSLVRDMDMAASSDTEFGPSSSTQVSGSVRSMRWRTTQGAQAEDMVCNSSDVTASLSTMPHQEEGNVDSTSQSGGRNVLRRSFSPHCSADSNNLNSNLTEDSEASSFCDSNSERDDYPATEEGQGVSSSGPADSQSTEVLDSGQVCVVSSVHSNVSSCAPSVASSPLSSYRVADSPMSGREVCSVSASSSQAVITMDGTDVQISLHPTSSESPSHSSTALSVVDSASQSQALPVCNSLASHNTDSSDPDMVGTSSQQDTSPQHGQGHSEASTSWSGATVSDQCDGVQLVSSLSPPTQGVGEGEVVNGCQAGCISSASSEDSFGAAPSTSVSSSEAQAAQQPAPVAKRKVSLFEYRNRLKGKGGSCGGPSTSPKSTTSDNRYSSRRSILDSNVALAPLPLFEPITINSDRRESKDKKEEKPKLMSLSDRLRIEFGLEDSEEEEKVHSAELLAQSSMDIPPPPPLPPNGVVGGLGLRSLSASTGLRPRPTDDEGDSFPTALPQGTATTNSIVAAAAVAVLANSVAFNHAGAPQALQPGFTWPAKLPGPSQALMGVSPGMATQQPLSTPPPAVTPPYGQGVAQQPLHIHTLQAAGGPHLPNGSHSQLPAPGFSTGPVYQALSQGHQPFRNGAKQQPPPPPPPLPNTAYPPFIAQTRTHPPPPHPQTSSLAASSSHLSTRHGRSASFSHRSPLMGVSPGAAGGRTRHSSSEDHVSPTRSSGRHHYDYGQGSAVKQKGSFSNHTGSDKKRH